MLLVIFVISLVLRFWGLERFNTFVFDEIYYADFAENYLSRTPFFNAHPPLSQYLIAIGIAIGEKLPFGAGVVNDLTGTVLKTWSYRWLNALTGSFIPLVEPYFIRFMIIKQFSQQMIFLINVWRFSLLKLHIF